MRLPLAALLSLSPVTLPAAEKPVPVDQEPKHKTVFENDVVRVIDVQIAPGEITAYHIHILPSVVVYLTKSTNRSESFPDGAILTRDISPGQSRWAPYDEKPLTHRVTNTGAGLFRVFDIELLKKPSGSEPLPALTGAHLKPIWDERLARSSSIQLPAHAKTQIPASRCALLLVGIKGSVQFSSSGSKAPASRGLKWADYQYFPPQSRLEISNPSGENAEAVLLELKL